MRYRTIHNTDLRVSNVCLGNCSEQIPAIPFSSTAMGFFEKLKKAGLSVRETGKRWALLYWMPIIMKII